MQSFRNASDFMGWLNSAVVIRDGEDGKPAFFKRPEIERRRHGGQGVLLLEKPRRLVWAVDVDLVLEGPCGDTPVWYADNPEQFPMGKCLKFANEPPESPDRSWLHLILSDEKMSGVSRIIVFAGCCGSYHDWYISLIKRLFPIIQWTFVSVPDLYERAYDKLEEIAEAFVGAGILRIE